MRTFVAIEISNNQVIESIKKVQTEININAKPVEEQNFHFTLQFLGEISEEMLKKIIDALNSIDFSGFTVNLRGIGAFPKPKFPRVIWIGTDDVGGEMLVELSEKVVNVLEPFGLRPDKAFKPHLTIFRIKKKIGDITKELEKRQSRDFGNQEVTNIKLKKSELTSNGPIYSDLLEVKARS